MAAETIDHLIIAFDNNLINEETLNNLRHHAEECMRMINRDISYLKKQAGN